MMRRKLVIYTLMLIAGISAGYFILEKVKIIFGTIFLIGMGIAIFFVEPDKAGTADTYAAKDTPGMKDAMFRERMICFSLMLIGFINFASNYAYFEGSFAAGDEVYAYGRILNAEDRGEYIRLILADRNSRRKLSGNIAKSEDERIDISRYIGATIELRGEIREISEADNPGCFDYRRYMRSKGIAYSLKVYSFEINQREIDVLWRMRRLLIGERERFISMFSDEIGGFIRGVIFGDKSEIDDDVMREFNMNSSGHILAVSGLHIGFLHSLLRLISGRRKTLPTSLAIIVIMLIYGEMTMWSSSTIRAVIVLSLSILSVNLHRPFDLLSSISAAAFVILIVRPYMLFNTGFQLSFAAMCSIAFFSKYISAFVGDILGVAASVQIGTIPLIAMSFHKFNTIALFINIPIILLSSFMVPVCILMLFVSIMMTRLPVFCIEIISFLCEALISLNHILAFDGGFSELSSGMSTSAAILYYILLFIFTSEWMRVNIIRRNYRTIKRTLSLLILPLIMTSVCLYDPFANDEIVFVAVGQGDCTHIRCNNEDVLIDGGGTDYVNTGERTLMPYLLSQRAKDVDVAILTHLHKDHYLGISELSDIYPVNAVAIPSDYRASFEKSSSTEYNEGKIRFNAKQMLYLDNTSRINLSDDVYIEALWPINGAGRDISIDDPNEHNMVYMIHYRGCRIMVTGDLLEEDELKLVDHYRGSDALDCDILKVAHHGSKSSSSEEFLDAASPRIAVIQCGRGNLYGHPHQQTLDRLEARGIETFRTDLYGAIGIDIRGSRISVNSYR